MIRSNVRVTDRFREITEQVDALAIRALGEAAAAAAREAIGAGAARRLTDVHVIPAHGDIEGFTAGIVGPWYYRYQSYGTLGRAIKAKRPGHRRSHAPGTGIEPNLMWQRARTAGGRILREIVLRG